MEDFRDALEPIVEQLLRDGEQLTGLWPATHVRLLDAPVALALTDQRLIVLPVDEDLRPSSVPTFITLDRIREYVIEDDHDLTLRLRFANKDRLTLRISRREPDADAIVRWLQAG